MDIYYLSENIFIKNGRLFFINNNKESLITKYNWHIKLNLLGWEKINIQWVKKLNKLSANIFKNSPYGVLECGDDGDCFFNCIAYGLNSNLNNNSDYYTSDKLRDLLSNTITTENFEDIINIYKIYYDNDEFYESWNPYEITIDVFKQEIKSNNFWGDYILINLLIEKLNINIVILNSDFDNNQFTIYNTLHAFDHKKKTIVLNYIDKHHFKLVGYFNGNLMVTYFEILPDELYKLIKV